MEMQDLCGDFKTHLIEKGNVTSFKLKFEICRIKLNKLGIFCGCWCACMYMLDLRNVWYGCDFFSQKL